ncbi:ABC transporter permease [Microbacterium invictum]|uniref:Osmoprotectant transport system permease protein n=1 Tax=Microbacterium invictum TaxID=515415 RepID=A0AA40SMF6_9MICO|nr:ABC transporter permease [Microbacterium invictum]MBB4138908.1 osmoprotectant transport system permease protein [Microbacterium invictum]
MNLIADALAWIFSGDPGAGLAPIPVAFVEHLVYTFLSVLIAGAIAVPAGWAIGHTGRGRDVAVAVSGAARAVPSFGLLLLLVLLLGVLHKPEAAVITFVLLAIPSLLAGAYTGFEAIDRAVVDAGRSMGMTGGQVLRRIEIPLGLPLLIGGVRAATLQVVATVTIAAYANLGGLGQYIITGLNLRRFDMVLGGAILVAVLALVLDALFALGQRFALPHGVRASSTRSAPRARAPRPAAA